MDLRAILDWMRSIDAKMNGKIYGPMDQDPQFLRRLNTMQILYPERFYNDSQAYPIREHMILQNPTYMDHAYERERGVIKDINRGPLSGDDLDKIMQNATKERYEGVKQKKYGML